jgi:hypothetical protein
MNAADFQRAHLRGISGSPFQGRVVVTMGSTEYTVCGCVVKSGDNKAEAEEYGLAHVQTLEVQIPKCRPTGGKWLPRDPSAALDAIAYEGRIYKIQSVSGLDDFSPVWVVQASAPL